MYGFWFDDDDDDDNDDDDTAFNDESMEVDGRSEVPSSMVIPD